MSDRAGTQIKIRAGQVYVGNGSRPTLTQFGKGKKIKVDSVDQLHINYDSYYRLPTYLFYLIFDFVPATDLEWLAVNVDEWNGHKYQGIVDDTLLRRIGNLHWSFTQEGHTMGEWQNMRYYLGLDKKPHYRLIDGEWVEK